MQEPDKKDTDGDNEDVGDLRIKGLLASEILSERHLGLVLLDAGKRDRFCGRLRILSKRNGWRLTGVDIAVIWEAAMTSLQRKVENGRFKKTGKLNALVRKIVSRRAIDFLRKRILIDHNVDVNEVKNERYDEHHESPGPKLVILVQACLKTLSEIEELVTAHDVHLFLATDGKKWPAPHVLTASVNAGRKKPLSVTAVRSARARARKKLRRIAMEN